MKDRFNNRVVTIILASMVIAIIGWLLVKNWDQILTFPWRINIKFLLLVVAFHFFGLVMIFWCWQLMLHRLGGKLQLLTGIRLFFVSNLTRRLPTLIPQVGGRLILYKREGIARTTVMNCILLETLIATTSGIITFLAFLPAYTTVNHNLILPLIIIGAVLILACIIRPQLLVQLTNWVLARAKRGGLTSMPNRNDMIVWNLLYITSWIFGGISFYFLPRALADIQGPGLFDAIGIITISTLIAFLVLPLPLSFGVREITGAALLTPWMPLTTALLFMIAFRLIFTIDDIMLAIIASFIGPRTDPNRALPDEPGQP
jgi:hypothetical protein